MRLFNTDGAVNCTDHYWLPSLSRLDLEDVLALIAQMLYTSLETTLADGLAQTWAYADPCVADEAHLVIFDRTPGKPWVEKVWQRQEHCRNLSISVWGM